MDLKLIRHIRYFVYYVLLSVAFLNKFVSLRGGCKCQPRPHVVLGRKCFGRSFRVAYKIQSRVSRISLPRFDKFIIIFSSIIFTVTNAHLRVLRIPE